MSERVSRGLTMIMHITFNFGIIVVDIKTIITEIKICIILNNHNIC